MGLGSSGVQDLVTLAPLLLALTGLASAVVLVLKHRSTRTTPKDQTYYETLVTRSWASEDRTEERATRIQAELDKEIGRREQLEQELARERGSAKDLVAGLREDLDKCKQRCALLQHLLNEERETTGALRRTLKKWGPPGGEQPAGS